MSNLDDQLDPIIDAHLRHLEGEGPAPELDSLPEGIRREAQARLALLDALWSERVDLPAEDPIARRFGFDRHNQAVAIDGRRVASLRKRAKLNLSQLLDRVTAAGGSISASALLNLEQRASVSVSQPTASALVAALNTDLALLEAGDDSDRTRTTAFLCSPTFYDLIDPWATDHHRAPSDVIEVVRRRLLTTHYRAEDVTTTQLIAIVGAILESLDP